MLEWRPWLLMGIAYEPTLRLYARPPWSVLTLPVAAFLFTVMTVDSARHHWQGQGGVWKGRSYGPRGATGGCPPGT